MSFVKLLEDVAGMISINNHLKGVLDFRGVSDLAFLFIVDIWHDVQNGSGYTLSSMFFQTFAVYTASSDLVYLCPNIGCNNPKETFFLGISFCDFFFSFVSTKMNVFFVSCAVMSPRSVCYHKIKQCKTLNEKVRYVLHSFT